MNDGVAQFQVAYSGPCGQVVKTLTAAELTVEEAIRRSGIMDQCPEIDLAVNKVGIFGKAATLDAKLYPGDRVEIYRPLIADPKEARKKRAVKDKEED